MSQRTYEAQYDAERGTVTCVAISEFGGDRYAVTTPAVSKEDAHEQGLEFVAMYRSIETAS